MNNFFGMLSRMKFINRWGLMRNTIKENIAEHSLDVAIIAHALAIIGNVRLGKHLNECDIAVKGMFHDITEIITGDMPTPVKYYSPAIKNSYKEVESIVAKQLLEEIPRDMQYAYRCQLSENSYPTEEEAWKYVKAADKLSAYIKCVQEKHTGNTDFKKAEQTILKALQDMNMEEVNIFIDEFLPSYNMTLDEINK